MMKILLFGGTAEGHQLSVSLAENGIEVTCCVATEYGRDILETVPNLTVRCGRLDAEEMAQLMREQSFDKVIDATHPYAQKVSVNIRDAASQTGREYLRLHRTSQTTDGVHEFPSVEACAAYLAETDGNVLLTTGSKDLGVFAGVEGYQERFWARILPTEESLKLAISHGFPSGHIICMLGPFSKELNIAMMNQIHARFLVTKESGKQGGYLDKTEAAKAVGAELLVIQRPRDVSGLTAEELLDRIVGKESVQ